MYVGWGRTASVRGTNKTDLVRRESRRVATE